MRFFSWSGVGAGVRLGADELPSTLRRAGCRSLGLALRISKRKKLGKDFSVYGSKIEIFFCFPQENQFNEQRVENYILRLKKARGKASQTRLENFFGATTTKSSSLMQKQQEQIQLELEKKKARGIRGLSSASGGANAAAKKAASKSAKRGPRTPSQGPGAKKEEPGTEETREVLKRRISEEETGAEGNNKKRLKTTKENTEKGEVRSEEREEGGDRPVEGQTDSVKAEREAPSHSEGDDMGPSTKAEREDTRAKEKKEQGSESEEGVREAKVLRRIEEAQSSLFDDGEGDENWPPNEVVVGGSTQ